MDEQQQDDVWRNHAGLRKEAEVESNGKTRYVAAIDVVVKGRFRVGVNAEGLTVTAFLQDALRQVSYYCTPEYVKDIGQPRFRITVPVLQECSTCFGLGQVRAPRRMPKLCPACKGKNLQKAV